MTTTKPNTGIKNRFIIKELIPAKLIYATMYISMACFLYGAAFLVSIGLSVTQAGLILGLRLIPALFTTPLFGAVADLFNKHKHVALTLAVFQAATAPVPWIAKALSGNVTEPSPVNVSQISLGRNEENVKGNELLFYTVLLIFSCTAVFGFPLLGFVDSAVTNLVKRFEGASFGQQRMFGPIGFAFGSLMVGFLSEVYDDPTMPKYSGAFCVFAVSSSLTILLFLILDQGTPCSPVRIAKVQEKIDRNDLNKFVAEDVHASRENVRIDQSVLDIDVVSKESIKIKNSEIHISESEPNKTLNKDSAETKGEGAIKKLFKTCFTIRVIFFFIIICHMGMNYTFGNLYMVLLMEDLGSSKTIIGIANAVSPVFELVTFPISSALIKWIGGNYPTFYIAAASYSIRFFLMSFIQNPWLFLPVQCFQSFGFALFWVAATEYAFSISPKDLQFSIFTTVTMMYYCLGGLIVCVGGGILYDSYGGRVLYRVASGNCAVMTILIILFYFKYEQPLMKVAEGSAVNDPTA